MNDVIWSDRGVSQGMARRLLGGTSNTVTQRHTSFAYTRLSSRAVLERRGLSLPAGALVPRTPAAPPPDDDSGFEAEGAERGTLGTTTIDAEGLPGGSHPAGLPTPAPAPAREVFPEFSPETIETLEKLLEWTLHCASASTTFLLDAQGFIIERAGEWSFELAEATGTQVLLAMERLGKAELTETSPRALNVEYDDHWLTAVPVAAGHDETYTLCLVTDAPLSSGRLRHISKSVAEGVLHV